MKKNTHSKTFPWGNLIRWIVTLSILLWLGFRIHWASLWQELSQAKIQWLLPAVLLVGVVLMGVSVRTWLLFKVHSLIIPLKRSVAITWIGQFFNSFLLGSTGGDVIKIYYAVKQTKERKERAALAIVADRVVGVLGLLILAVLALPFQLKWAQSSAELQQMEIVILILFGGLLLGLATMLFFPFRWFPAWVTQFWKKVPLHQSFGSLYTGCKDHLRHPKLLALSMGLALLIHLCNFTSGYFVALALGLDATYSQILVTLALVYCLISLPISVSGHGVRELAFVKIFTLYGIITPGSGGEEVAVAFSILIFAITLFWSLVGGVVYLCFEHQAKKDPHYDSVPTVSQ